MVDKTASLSEAVSTHLNDGDTVALEGFGHLVPVAAAHEIIRQRFSGLTLARMSCDVIVDQLLGAGCLQGLISSFVANSSAGSLYELRRRVEHCDPEPLWFDEYSHGGMVARYQAGAAKLPFQPIASYRGSDLAKKNPRIRTVDDPYGGPSIHVVPALNPDLTIVHAQRADSQGNVQAWGMLGIQTEAAFAGRRLVVTVEEIVDEDIVRSDPNRTIIPAHIVDSVVPVPRGSHPHAVQGYYDRDDEFSRAWSTLAREASAVSAWLEENIHGTADHEEFLSRIGLDRFDRLSIRDTFSTPVNYGGRV
ncbi:CoA transferase subunit A [Brevibacterium renqingii]|uniref:CoA transferase subunit A n=1 Tax=Brevibacterium renqingii TaxID=2776916 RepID=UPI001ADF18B2|nr:CoA-transferase [Brevibacterium renqingii]